MSSCRSCLDPATWELAWENLDGERRELDRVRAAVEAAFGALPEGFFATKLPDSSKVLIGVGAELPKRCVWLANKTAEPVSYEDYAALAASQEGALVPKTVAGVCSALTRYYDNEGHKAFHLFQTIEDGQAYQDEYREKNWGTFKLRYWVDEIRETACDCPELHTVASPVLEGNRLLAYFKGEKYQPFRLEVDLSSLSKEPPEIGVMSTETLVHDTREGPSLREMERLPRPDMPSPEIEMAEAEEPPPPPPPAS